MRYRSLLAALSLAAIAACHDGSAVTDPSLDGENPELVPDYAVSPAAVIDGAGIGASMLPEEIRLTAEQKAEIAALHEAFMQANAADIAALRALEQQFRLARRAGASRADLHAILEQARPIQQRLAAAFAALQDSIWAVYTEEQRAWIESHRPKLCGPDGPPRLTDAQLQQIRSLREAFHAAIAADLALIKQVHQDARAAHEAGKTRAEILAILATAQPAMERVRAAERQLHQDVLAVLTPEQRDAWCVVRARVHPARHP
jgi:hypothetical protein